MRESLLDILRAPKSGERLRVHAFEMGPQGPDGASDILEGILVSEKTQQAFPILAGVPMMLPAAFPEDFLRKNAGRIHDDPLLSRLNLQVDHTGQWSFSREWEHHFEKHLTRTWGWTVEERVQQFCMETKRPPDGCQARWILDAGCGNGQLSEGLADKLGACVVGLDYSTSVFSAEHHRRSPGVHFIRADLQCPPFAPDTFDIIISNGVLHHTPDTYATFREVAAVAKPGGSFYLWLYRRPERFLKRVFVYFTLDVPREVTSRLPIPLQPACISTYALLLRVWNRLHGTHADLARADYITAAYDALTPRWAHYHTPIEVSRWFFQNGYSAATLTHWDNPGGFGMVAVKAPLDDTPGVRFARRRPGDRQDVTRG